ncbi:hypothetical protein NKH85_21850 [Mesorhizobium sp. M0924]|uniref:hypothetical protein n=1 Tax=unclassified Mesorhizobium TaxID=325217 RepID=UPI0012DC523D|nr:MULTISPECIES: hypothetical protein [unclassified Mesorhizobium]WJI44640.1 hypothetical protein NL532_29300 [Mesorhizobium sp. C120A]
MFARKVGALRRQSRARRGHMVATGRWLFDRLRDEEIADSMLTEIGFKHVADSNFAWKVESQTETTLASRMAASG